MGANNGTGQPNWFRCSKCRRHGQRDDGWAGGVTLTGRKREHVGKQGARNTYIDRQYRCDSCGHVGWSCHVDLAMKAGEHRELHLADDGSTYLPTWAS
jgi:predicted RNA-binding Zn-ribbon protein involved in translation (DUF1610 family)